MFDHLSFPCVSVDDSEASELNRSLPRHQKVKDLHSPPAPVGTVHVCTPSSFNLSALQLLSRTRLPLIQSAEDSQTEWEPPCRDLQDLPQEAKDPFSLEKEYNGAHLGMRVFHLTGGLCCCKMQFINCMQHSRQRDWQAGLQRQVLSLQRKRIAYQEGFPRAPLSFSISNGGCT